MLHSLVQIIQNQQRINNEETINNTTTATDESISSATLSEEDRKMRKVPKKCNNECCINYKKMKKQQTTKICLLFITILLCFIIASLLLYNHINHKTSVHSFVMNLNNENVQWEIEQIVRNVIGEEINNGKAKSNSNINTLRFNKYNGDSNDYSR